MPGLTVSLTVHILPLTEAGDIFLLCDFVHANHRKKLLRLASRQTRQENVFYARENNLYYQFRIRS